MVFFCFERVFDIILKVIVVFFLEIIEDLVVFEENFEYKLKNKILRFVWWCYYKIYGDMSFFRKNKENSLI